jgi:hypothetical protein
MSRLLFSVVRKRFRSTLCGMTRKNPHAVALGRKGGLKGGKATAARRTPEERSEAARKAVQARWAKAKKKGVQTSANKQKKG